MDDAPTLPALPEEGVPRPAGASPGAPAPWAGVPVGDRRGVGLARVRRALDLGARSVVPGAEERAPADGRRSAVLVALFEEEGEARVVLTRRASGLRHHRGEVSFPGGRMEPGELPVDTARREAHEEVGLDPALVVPVGRLSPVSTFSSGSFIVPVVGVLDGRPHLVASPGEVARIFDVELAELAADGVFHEERWPTSGRRVPGTVDGRFPVWFFEVAGETVWGATARILADLLGVVLIADKVL
ncbi:MAG: NUDIX hydrolase [Acidimicrobiales bacterium]